MQSDSLPYWMDLRQKFQIVKAINELTLLHDKNEEAVRCMGRAEENAMQVFHYIEATPIIDTGKTAEALNITLNTASVAVKRLMGAGILMHR